MASNDFNDCVESPAGAMRRIMEAQFDLSAEERDYIEKMEAYFEGPGHDQSA